MTAELKHLPVVGDELCKPDCRTEPESAQEAIQRSEKNADPDVAACVQEARERLGFGGSTAVPPTPPRCSVCAVDAPAGTNNCPKCGSWLTANRGAVRNDRYSKNVPPDLRLSANQLMDGVVSDLGGLSELSTLEVSYIRKLGDLEIVIRGTASDLATRGLMTPGGGKMRPSFDAFVTALGAFDKYASKLGLKRRQRRIPSAAELLRGVK